MAHWARINQDNIVEQVIVTSNEDADEGQSWIADNLEGTWLKTSYNTIRGQHTLGGEPFRKNFAQLGYYYSSEIDGFVPPKREFEANFVLNPETGTWIPDEAFPLDADYVIQYGSPIPVVDEAVVLEDGTEIIVKRPDVAPEAKVYRWITEANTWGMMPNSDYPKPEGDYYWHPIIREWQAPTSEKPEGNYFWNVFEGAWSDIPLSSETATE